MHKRALLFLFWEVSPMISSGDLLKADINIIIQQVSCSGRMGGGLFGAINRKYPEVRKHYLGFSRSFIEDDDERSLLGRVNYVDTYDRKLVASVFAQVGIRKSRRDLSKYTEEKYLLQGIDEVFRYASWRGYSVGIPYKIGCDRSSGGDWDVVYDGIMKLKEKYNVDCRFYRVKRSIWEGFR